MRWTCKLPQWRSTYRFSDIRVYIERLNTIASGSRPSTDRGIDPPVPEALLNGLLPGAAPTEFFWPERGTPQLYIERSILQSRVPRQLPNYGRPTYESLYHALANTQGHVLLWKGLGKTTALLHMFWTVYRDYLGNSNSDNPSYSTLRGASQLDSQDDRAYYPLVAIPYWLVPGDALLAEEEWLSHFPPLLIFVDLKRADFDGRSQELIARISSIAANASCKHHRFVLAYQSHGKQPLDVASMELLRIVSHVFEVQALTIGEARAEWLRRGIDGQNLTILSQGLEEAIRRTRSLLPTNLPEEIDRFIGRVHDVAGIHQMLTSRRLLTLTGPGGIGKTRLALHVAHIIQGNYDHGAFMVDFADVQLASEVPSLIAKTLAIKEGGDGRTIELLKENLREQRMLLVLDNFDHVMDAASLVLNLLESSSYLHILVTSREAFRFKGGDYEYKVPPLEVPPAAEHHTQYAPKGHKVIAELPADEYDAVKLFIERSDLGSNISALDLEAVSQICAMLDGLPLAIELAAAYLRSTEFPPKQLLAHLRRKPSTVGDWSQIAVQSRHHTLHECIAWSYDLLKDSEKRLFARLSVFVGGFTFEAAEAVCGVTPDPLPSIEPEAKAYAGVGVGVGSQLDVWEGIGSLASKSLLRKLMVVGGDARYSMLETIREFAKEKLSQEGDEHEIRYRHLAFYSALAEDAMLGVPGTLELRGLDLMDMEHTNMLAGLSWALEAATHEKSHLQTKAEAQDSDYAGLAMRLGNALARFWQFRNYSEEMHQWFSRLGELARSLPTPIPSSVQFFGCLGARALYGGDLSTGRAYLEEALALAHELGDQLSIAGLTHDLGRLVSDEGSLTEADNLYGVALDIYTKQGNRRGVAAVLCSQGVLAYKQGYLVEARKLLNESRTICKSLDCGWDCANVSVVIGHLAYVQRHYLTAWELYREALTTYERLWYLPGFVDCFYALGNIAQVWNAPARASRLFGAATKLGEVISYIPPSGEGKSRETWFAATPTQPGEDNLAAEFAKGAAMPIEEIIDYALENIRTVEPKD